MTTRGGGGSVGVIVSSCGSGTGQSSSVVTTDCCLRRPRGGDGVDRPLSLLFPYGGGVGWPPDADQGVGHHRVEAAAWVGSARCDVDVTDGVGRVRRVLEHPER